MSDEERNNEGNNAAIQQAMERSATSIQQGLGNPNVEANPVELQRRVMTLQHPLRADQSMKKVFYISNIESESEYEIIVEPCPAEFLEKLESDVENYKLLTREIEGDENSRVIINEGALEGLVIRATKKDCPENRARRAAQIANAIQPNIAEYKEAGEMFLQQIVYSPIAELFCAFSTSYCADKKVACSHGVYAHKSGNKYEQHSVSCSPDAALRLVDEFDLIAMMELKCNGSEYPYDFYKLKLMTAISVMAIADYLVRTDQKKRDDIDIAIPFIQGCFNSVVLYVMRLKGVGSPKIHYVTGTKFWDSPDNTGKLRLLSKLAIILACIVNQTIECKIPMEAHFRQNRTDATNNAIDPSNKSGSKRSGSRNTDTGTFKKGKQGKGDILSSNTNQSSNETENAAKLAASCSGLIHGLSYPFSRICELDMIDDDNAQADFKFFQQESPFFFKGIFRYDQGDKGNTVFFKVWCEGDRHTSRKNIDEEIRFFKRVNVNGVPSPTVIDSLTALDVECMTHLDKLKPSIYHMLVTQYHHNDAVDENDILVFALSLVRAVQKLHSIGILHCDIKPSNIIWDATQKAVRLIDFEHAQDEWNARWYTATRKYEAPEITSGKAHTRKSDAYSVGKTLDSVIKEFKKPIARDIADVVTSLLVGSVTNRLKLVEAEQQLEKISGGSTFIVLTGPTGSNCLSAKRFREEVVGSSSNGIYSLGVKVDG